LIDPLMRMVLTNIVTGVDLKIEYISHACLLIDTGDVRIATDPWFDGPAYSQQWYVFPKPVNAEAVETADVIAISHGHEDHFHPKTLRTLANKTARVFYPDSWFGGAKEFIESLGFANVTEAINRRKYQLTKTTSLTYVANGNDNIMVIESGGRVLVDVNDALHSEPDATIDFFVSEIRKRWPRIDALFCGFGGASYFPNMLHVVGKDDRAIGKVREQLFARNFCRVVAALKPVVAVPFAADFALLGTAGRWINDVRFPRAHMKKYFDRHFAEADHNQRIEPMYPGDALDGVELKAASPYRARLKDGELSHLLEEQYAEEIARKQNPKMLTAEEGEELAAKLRDHINMRLRSIEGAQNATLKFCIEISDDAERRAFNINIENGEARLQRAERSDADCAVVINAPSRIVRYAMKYEFGGDVIGIGYGAEFQFRDRESAGANLDQICYQLLSLPLPSRRQSLKKDPGRMLAFLARQPPVQTWKSWKKSAAKLGNVNYDRSIWLLRDAEELRRIFDLPEMDESIGRGA
jgi:L-ascorbate metabolism protein UlaG (beta-lactamase superfamily)